MSREAICQAAVERVKQILSGHDSDRPFVIGLGTGSTVATFASLLMHSDIFKSHKLSPIVIIPTSLQSIHLALQLVNSGGNKIILGSISQFAAMDCLVDGFDELDLTSGWMIKGGGGAHTMEIIVAMSSKHNIYIGSGDKVVDDNGFKSVPVEVLQGAHKLLLNSLEAFNVTGKIRDCAGGKMGPVITDNGNLIVDVDVKGIPLADLQAIMVKISGIPGVVGHGLFMNLTDEVFTSDRHNSTLIHKKYDRSKTYIL